MDGFSGFDEAHRVLEFGLACCHIDEQLAKGALAILPTGVVLREHGVAKFIERIS